MKILKTFLFCGAMPVLLAWRAWEFTHSGLLTLAVQFTMLVAGICTLIVLEDYTNG